MRRRSRLAGRVCAEYLLRTSRVSIASYSNERSFEGGVLLKPEFHVGLMGTSRQVSFILRWCAPLGGVVSWRWPTSPHAGEHMVAARE